jgi:hypothetical protein
MGSGQTVIERDRAVGGREYVRGEVFLFGEGDKESVTPEKYSVIVKGKNLKLPIYHILLISVVSGYKSVKIYFAFHRIDSTPYNREFTFIYLCFI